MNHKFLCIISLSLIALGQLAWIIDKAWATAGVMTIAGAVILVIMDSFKNNDQ